MSSFWSIMRTFVDRARGRYSDMNLNLIQSLLLNSSFADVVVHHD